MNNNFCPNCGSPVVAGQGCPNCMGQQNGMMNNGQPNNININPSVQMVQPNNGMYMNGQPNTMNPGMQMGQPMNGVVVDPNWKNSKATWGLVLGIISFFIFGFLAFIGLGLGIGALNDAKQHNGKGKGVAIAAIVVSSICSVLVLINIITAVAAV